MGTITTRQTAQQTLRGGDYSVQVTRHVVKRDGVTVGKITEQHYAGDKPFYDVLNAKGKRVIGNDYRLVRFKSFQRAVDYIAAHLA